MSIQTARLDLRLTDADKRRIERAANLLDMPVSVFVREAVLREADQAIARPQSAAQPCRGNCAAAPRRASAPAKSCA